MASMLALVPDMKLNLDRNFRTIFRHHLHDIKLESDRHQRLFLADHKDSKNLIMKLLDILFPRDLANLVLDYSDPIIMNGKLMNRDEFLRQISYA